MVSDARAAALIATVLGLIHPPTPAHLNEIARSQRDHNARRGTKGVER